VHVSQPIRRVSEKTAQINPVLTPEERLIPQHAVQQHFIIGIEDRSGITLIVGKVHGHRAATAPGHQGSSSERSNANLFFRIDSKDEAVGGDVLPSTRRNME